MATCAPVPGSEKTSTRGAVHAALILLAASAYALIVVQRQIGTYDLSPLIDLSHRLSRGESPGKDFILTFPPLFVLAVKATSFGTLHWADLSWASIIAAFATLALLVADRGEAVRTPATGAVTGALIAVPLAYTNHVWHSSISQYAAVAFVAIVSSELARDGTPRSGWTRAASFLLLLVVSGLLAIAKQNTAPLLGATLAFLAIAPVRWSRKGPLVAGAVLGAALGLVGAALVLGLRASDLLYLYTATLGRARPDPEMYRSFGRVVSSYPLAIALLLALVVTVRAGWRRWEWRDVRLDFLVVAGCVSLIPIATDWDTKLNNVTFPMFVMLLVLAGPERRPSRAFLASVAVVLATSFVGGWARERMKHVGPFYEQPADRTIEAGYFAGLRTGAQFERVIHELRRVEGERPRRVFCGPRLEFCYALSGWQSPRGMPLWWHPGSSFDLRDSARVFEAFVRNDFGLLVFAGSDRTRMPPEILDYIAANYRSVPGYSTLEVLQKGDPREAPSPTRTGNLLERARAPSERPTPK